MKRVILASCFLGLAGISSFAYAHAHTSSSQVVVNQNLVAQPRFEFTIGALFLKPSSTLLDYAVHGYPLPVDSPHWQVSAVNPGYSTGFDLAGRYFFANTRNDVHLSWDHLRTSDSDSTQAGTSEFVVVMYQTGPSALQVFNNPSTHADATAKFYYDVVNLDAGRSFDFSDAQLRVSLGVSGAQIKENLSATFRDNASTYSINTTNNSRFTGIGPMFGLDGKYKIPYGFGLSGSATVAGLVGYVDPVTSFTSSSPELTASGISSNYQTISPRNTTQIIPAFAGKIGLDYSHTFYNTAIFTAAVGYEYAVYMNALAAYNPTTIFGNINTGTIALASVGKSVSNFSVQGPFLNFSFGF